MCPTCAKQCRLVTKCVSTCYTERKIVNGNLFPKDLDKAYLEIKY